MMIIVTMKDTLNTDQRPPSSESLVQSGLSEGSSEGVPKPILHISQRSNKYIWGEKSLCGQI